MSKSARHFRHLTLSPTRLSASMDEQVLDDEDFAERILFLEESIGGVTLAVEGNGGGPTAGPTGGALVELDAEQARQLGDALNAAADELAEEGAGRGE